MSSAVALHEALSYLISNSIQRGQPSLSREEIVDGSCHVVGPHHRRKMA